MNRQNNIILCSTFHDPQFTLKNLLISTIPTIKKLFLKSIVCCTPATGKEVGDFLTNNGIDVVYSPEMAQLDTYRFAIKTALEYIKEPKIQRLFYIDFDRLIHWVNVYPEELEKIFENNTNVDYLHIGRSNRAFKTHPETQKDTEIIVNELGSRILGLTETHDLISVCYLISKELGEKILKLKNPTDTGFYGSWPIYFWNWTAPSLKCYLQVEGLEWETPDRFKKEIDMIGRDEWLKKFQSPIEWKKRVEFLYNCLIEFAQLTEFKFKQ